MDDVVVGDGIRFECFYLIGANSFHARTDGGYDNLAMVYNGKICDWDHGAKNLTCQQEFETLTLPNPVAIP